MTTTKHTPGPWHWERYTSPPDKARVYHGDRNKICDCSVANARLIALAPEMAEALRALLGDGTYETEYDGRTYDLCKGCGGQNEKHNHDCPAEKARALLAKLGEGA